MGAKRRLVEAGRGERDEEERTSALRCSSDEGLPICCEVRDRMSKGFRSLSTLPSKQEPVLVATGLEAPHLLLVVILRGDCEGQHVIA